MARQEFDVVVVGGGSAGCVVAARLAEHPGRRVLLLEAGPVDVPAAVRDVTVLDAPAPLRRDHPTELVRGVAGTVVRGRLLGGSAAINGGYFVRATPADLDGWQLPGWAHADVLPAYVRSESDADFGPSPGGPDSTGGRSGPRVHGDRGPMPIRRPAGPLLAPTTEPFLRAAQRLGYPAEPDKNACGPPGAGLVPSNVVDGERIDTARAYLPGSAVQVRGDTAVTGLVLDGDRAVGVATADGIVEAGEVVLAAGAVATPQLLQLAGLGPADALRAAGIAVRHDLPVGRAFSDHPAVYLPFRPHVDVAPHPRAVGAQVALHLDSGADPAGDVELLLFARPFVPGGDLHVMCALQAPVSRGTLAVTSPDPAADPRIAHRYLRTETDRRRLRHAVRVAADLLRAGLGTRTAPEGFVLGNDRRLDGWIRDHLTTSSHLCGTAPMGPVVDDRLRVHGVAGLRVADTSVFPVVPRRGPGAGAVMVGERAAELLPSSA